MNNFLKIVIIGAVLLHGLGHFLFAAPLFGVASDWKQSTRSWLLGDSNWTRIAGGILFVIAILGFVIAAWGMISGAAWWRSLLIGSAMVSQIGMIAFWSSPVPSGVIPATVFNIIVLGSLLLFNWPKSI